MVSMGPGGLLAGEGRDVVRARHGLTGVAADERHRVRPSDLVYVGMALAHELIIKGNMAPWSSRPEIKAALGAFTAEKVTQVVESAYAMLTKAAAALPESSFTATKPHSCPITIDATLPTPSVKPSSSKARHWRLNSSRVTIRLPGDAMN